MKKKSFLVISGPNLNLLGARKISIYGEGSLEDIHKGLALRADELNVQVDCRQFNSEGGIIDSLQEALGRFDGVIINARGARALQLRASQRHRIHAPSVRGGVHLQRPCARRAPAYIRDRAGLRGGHRGIRQEELPAGPGSIGKSE